MHKIVNNAINHINHVLYAILIAPHSDSILVLMRDKLVSVKVVALIHAVHLILMMIMRMIIMMDSMGTILIKYSQVNSWITVLLRVTRIVC